MCLSEPPTSKAWAQGSWEPLACQAPWGAVITVTGAVVTYVKAAIPCPALCTRPPAPPAPCTLAVPASHQGYSLGSLTVPTEASCIIPQTCKSAPARGFL